MNDRSRTIERRLLQGALLCAVLLIVGFFVLVSTPWGHQFDDDAFFGRKALSRRIIRLDSDILDIVNTQADTRPSEPRSPWACFWSRRPGGDHG